MTSPYTIARLQDRDITRVMNRSSVFASRLWRVAKDAAERRSLRFDSALVARAQDELVELMAWTYFMRTRLNTRRRTLGKQMTLQLAQESIQVLANRASRQLNIDAGKLRERFTTVTGRTLRRELAGVRDILRTGLDGLVRQGLKGDAGTQYLLAYLRKRGLSPRSSHYIDTLVRTHVSIVYGIAQRASYAGDPDLWGFEYVTMEDERVRKSHELIHGVRRRWDDPFWDENWPPNGWGCRCQVVAIYGTDIRQTRIPASYVPDTAFNEQYAVLRATFEKNFGQNSPKVSI